MAQTEIDRTSLPNLALPIRSLFTGYILVVGVGLLMAGMQVLLTHGMADGEFGISVDDIVYSYYGNRSNSKLETKLNGSMQDKAPTAVKRESLCGLNKEQSAKSGTDVLVNISSSTASPVTA